ncbi:MAG TPA: hypothetical protein VK400_17975 [Pyrinomonadaceae bacterium]|nr:hypothetical protein [Pyrinomonadaceae bacterium]
MHSLESPYYEVTRRDLTKDKALKYGAWVVPALTAILPALIFFLLFLFSNATPTAAMYFFLTLISLVGGFIFGLIISGGLLFYRSRWLSRIRERIAVDGIKANEVDFFKHELTGSERKSLREMENKNRLLADAYRETLASRLTATRILKTTKQELLLVKRRENKLKYLKSENAAELQKQLGDDHTKLEEIKSEAEQMRVEAETRLQMIEAASRRGTNFSDTELALKRLTARSAELPLALEALKMEEEIRRELESEK